MSTLILIQRKTSDELEAVWYSNKDIIGFLVAIYPFTRYPQLALG